MTFVGFDIDIMAVDVAIDARTRRVNEEYILEINCRLMEEKCLRLVR